MRPVARILIRGEETKVEMESTFGSMDFRNNAILGQTKVLWVIRFRVLQVAILNLEVLAILLYMYREVVIKKVHILVL